MSRGSIGGRGAAAAEFRGLVDFATAYPRSLDLRLCAIGRRAWLQETAAPCQARAPPAAAVAIVSNGPPFNLTRRCLVLLSWRP